jgi:FixJ family two-component response regulator
MRKHSTPATVLIVDDDPSTLRSLKRLILAAGFQVEAFDHPSALLAGAFPTSNACLVVDINLPEMNGIEMCQALASSGRGLPVIFITGRSEAEVRGLVQNSGAIAVLFKPVDEQPLLEAIGRAISVSKI